MSHDLRSVLARRRLLVLFDLILDRICDCRVSNGRELIRATLATMYLLVVLLGAGCSDFKSSPDLDALDESQADETPVLLTSWKQAEGLVGRRVQISGHAEPVKGFGYRVRASWMSHHKGLRLGVDSLPHEDQLLCASGVRVCLTGVLRIDLPNESEGDTERPAAIDKQIKPAQILNSRSEGPDDYNSLDDDGDFGGPVQLPGERSDVEDLLYLDDCETQAALAPLQ